MTRYFVKMFVAVFFCSILSNSTAFSEDASLSRSENYTPRMPIKILKKITLPKGYHEGITLHENRVWVSNGKGKNTWVIDPETGEVESEIKSAGRFTEAIALAPDGLFWITDWDDKKIYRANFKNDEWEIVSQIPIQDARPTGIVRANGEMYVITWERGLGTKYYISKFDKEGNISERVRIKRIHEPAHIASDGKYFWITSWYSGIVYKINLDSREVEGSFKSPAASPTGIASDGKYLWITGTSADLYKVDISGGESATQK
ncbi:MAG: hypothetical protein ISS33_00510 [Candidatus Omnitrophica bacterium]|nr:hypothetical protein [Candidatus Omnitrophota bacterium]